MNKQFLVKASSFLAAAVLLLFQLPAAYRIGASKADITGPCVGVGFMGMSNPAQTGKGIHTRLFSRAFVIEDTIGGKRVAIVCADLALISMAIKEGVVAKLQRSGPVDGSGNPVYGDGNVMLLATHTHAGPGGYSNYYMYNFSIGGFVAENFATIVDGIFNSIVMADSRKQEGQILLNGGDLENCGGIRSINAYKRNPEVSIGCKGKDDVVEPLYRRMVLLKFVAAAGEAIGVINWFALHPTCIGEKSRLISADSKGCAEYLLEQELARETGKPVVAAFANSCCGDISPNAGLSECGEKYDRPDGIRDIERSVLFGQKQFAKAHELYHDLDQRAYPLSGQIDSVLKYVDFSDCKVGDSGKRTWPAAMGFGMVNGSEEDSAGLGIKRWGEGVTRCDIGCFEKKVVNVAKVATEYMKIKWPDIDSAEYKELESGHGNKAVLLPVGLMTKKGAPLAPSVLPLQMIKLGELLLVAHPGELTTVAGVRMRKAVAEAFGKTGNVREVVVAAYANAFSSYTTTPQEYDAQEYEGASTLFGPWTYPAFEQENVKLARALRDHVPVVSAVEPEKIPNEKLVRKKIRNALPDADFPNLHFGEFEANVKELYKKGDTVSVSFLGGYPNWDLKLDSSYFVISRQGQVGWENRYSDDDSCTTFKWVPKGMGSLIRIEWIIPVDCEPGDYKITYKGKIKPFPGSVRDLFVETKIFKVQ